MHFGPLVLAAPLVSVGHWRENHQTAHMGSKNRMIFFILAYTKQFLPHTTCKMHCRSTKSLECAMAGAYDVTHRFKLSRALSGKIETTSDLKAQKMPSLDTGAIVLVGITFFAAFVNGAIG